MVSPIRLGFCAIAIAAAIVSIASPWLTEHCHEDEPVSLISKGHGLFVPDTRKDFYRRVVPTAFMVFAIPTWNTDRPAQAAAIMAIAWALLHTAVTVLMGETCPGQSDAKLGAGSFAAYAAAVASAWSLASGLKQKQV